MSKSSSEKTPATGAPAETPAWKNWFRLPSEEELHGLWLKYRNYLFVCCAVVVLAILAQGVYKGLMARREAGIRAAFAEANTPAKLQAFIREHSGHRLAGAAYLKLGDDAYADSRFVDAGNDYEKAAAALKGTPFAGRALLGEGVSLIESGQTTEGSAILEKLADDSSGLQAVRSEAAYHLAALALAQHQYTQVEKLTDLVMQVDANGIWAQRALMLRAQVPPSAVTASPPKKSESGPTVSVKLPAQ